MDWQLESLMALRAIVAVLLGALVGYEREKHGQDAGIRTYAAVCLGACVFGLVSSHITTVADTRIAAQIVSGVGFLGAGVIMRDQGRTLGLTTAATLWTTASLGLAVAYGMYVLSVLGAIITFGLLAIHHLPGWNRITKKENSLEKEKHDH
ncbi:MAG: MgtC/SapB family protein [Candidatus Melainabacteria bacterium]|nr:MgtC/SapB family protein [Candidatus Melainabacteria bacterium]